MLKVLVTASTIISIIPAYAEEMSCKNWGHRKDPDFSSKFTCEKTLYHNNVLYSRSQYINNALNMVPWADIARKKNLNIDITHFPDKSLDIPYLTNEYGLVYQYCHAHPSSDYWDALQAVAKTIPCPRWWNH